VKTAQQALARWQAAGATAAGNWTQGIQNTQKDQAALAAAAQPLWLAGVQQAAAANRFANGVTRRGTGYWKSQSEAKAGNYTTGYSAGGQNFAAAITKIINAEQQIVASLPPRGDINANLQRANQVALQLHNQRGNLGAA
jgi:hypothetical protein